MELDDLKGAWKELGRQLERQNDLTLQNFRDRKLARAQASLRPLIFGQLAQIVFGIPFVVLGAIAWTSHLGGGVLLVAGLVVHLYGIASIVAAALVLAAIRRMDYAAPVVAIQTQLARLRRSYIASSLALGLSWWILWIPFALVAFYVAFHVNLYVHMREPIWWMVASGVAGLLLSVWFLIWSRSATRQSLSKAVDDVATGFSLRRARSHLDELTAFGCE